MCLYGFVFELSHLAFRRGVGSPLPLHRPSPSPQPSQNRTTPRTAPSPLPFNERSVGFVSALSLENRQHPCLPLKKGEVLLLGQAEPTMVGLFPVRTINEIFRTIPCFALSPLPYERSVCFASALSLEKHYTLASLVKGRWLGGKTQAYILQRFYVIYPTFIITKSVCRQDGGDCSSSAPSMRFSALSHSLFVGRAFVCAYTVLHSHYPTRFS